MGVKNIKHIHNFLHKVARAGFSEQIISDLGGRMGIGCLLTNIAFFPPVLVIKENRQPNYPAVGGDELNYDISQGKSVQPIK